MTTPNTPRYLRLKSDTAPKLGLRAEGGIHYSILCDADRQEMFIMVTCNDGGGYFSKEITPMANILACLPTGPDVEFAGKVLAKACVSRTANQPGFLMAILRHEGLATAADKPHLHVRSGDVAAWSAALLGLPGEPYAPNGVVEAQAPVVQAVVDPDPAPGEPTASAKKRSKRSTKPSVADGDASD